MNCCRRKWLLLSINLVVICALSGCGSSGSTAPPDAAAPADPAPAPADPPAVAATDTTPEQETPAPAARRPDEVWEDESGRRYLGQIPYDVFFDHPLAVAGEQQVVATTAETPAVSSDPDREMPTASNESAAPTADTSSSSGGDWESLLPVEVLESEVKSIRNFLNQKLQSVGTYNSAVTMIPPRAATLAALAAIAADHSGHISWQADAGYVRDLAASMNSDVLQRGPKDQRRLLAIFENLADTLNRSRPSDLPAPDPETALSDVAEMRLLMMRMEQAEQRLRTEVNESSFRSQAELVTHEAAMLSGLMQAMATETYGYADDPEFLGHAEKIMESGRRMKDAADSGDFTAFELGLTQVAGTCQACHRDYKNN